MIPNARARFFGMGTWFVFAVAVAREFEVLAGLATNGVLTFAVPNMEFLWLRGVRFVAAKGFVADLEGSGGFPGCCTFARFAHLLPQ